MKTYFERLRAYIADNLPDFGDGEPVQTLLYEVHAESNKMDDGTQGRFQQNLLSKEHRELLLRALTM